jgi:hypothetical protein
LCTSAARTGGDGADDTYAGDAAATARATVAVDGVTAAAEDDTEAAVVAVIVVVAAGTVTGGCVVLATAAAKSVVGRPSCSLDRSAFKLSCFPVVGRGCGCGCG